jgi:hypothetical protein
MTGSAKQSSLQEEIWIASSLPLLAMTNSTAKLPDGQITSDFPKSCQAPFAKIFCFASDPNQFTDSHRPVPKEGRWPRHQRWARDAVDAVVSGARIASQTNGAAADGEVVWF